MNDIHVRVGETFADGVSNLPTVAVGGSVPLDLRFQENNHPNVFSSPSERHEALYRVVRWANDATVLVDRSSNGVSHYSEEVPERAPAESFVRPVQTGEAVTRLPDFWGIITGGEDTREPGNGRVSLRLEITALAMIDEYDNADELAADLGTSVIQDGV